MEWHSIRAVNSNKTVERNWINLKRCNKTEMRWNKKAAFAVIPWTSCDFYVVLFIVCVPRVQLLIIIVIIIRLPVYVMWVVCLQEATVDTGRLMQMIPVWRSTALILSRSSLSSTDDHVSPFVAPAAATTSAPSRTEPSGPNTRTLSVPRCGSTEWTIVDEYHVSDV